MDNHSIAGTDSKGRVVTIEYGTVGVQVMRPARFGATFVIGVPLGKVEADVRVDPSGITVREAYFRTSEDTTPIAQWLADPSRRSIRDEVASAPAPDFDPIFSEPLGSGQRWQYAVINTGSFSAAGRMKKALDVAGRAGWELVTIYDKSSNWISGMEKGFMLLKRPVPADVEPAQWCVFVSQVGP